MAAQKGHPAAFELIIESIMDKDPSLHNVTTNDGHYNHSIIDPRTVIEHSNSKIHSVILRYENTPFFYYYKPFQVWHLCNRTVSLLWYYTLVRKSNFGNKTQIFEILSLGNLTFWDHI